MQGRQKWHDLWSLYLEGPMAAPGYLTDIGAKRINSAIDSLKTRRIKVRIARDLMCNEVWAYVVPCLLLTSAL